MYMQMNDLLTLSKLTQEGRDDFEIPEMNKVRGRSTEMYTRRKVRLEKARNEVVFKKLQTSKPNRQWNKFYGTARTEKPNTKIDVEVLINKKRNIVIFLWYT